MSSWQPHLSLHWVTGTPQFHLPQKPPCQCGALIKGAGSWWLLRVQKNQNVCWLQEFKSCWSIFSPLITAFTGTLQLLSKWRDFLWRYPEQKHSENTTSVETWWCILPKIRNPLRSIFSVNKCFLQAHTLEDKNIPIQRELQTCELQNLLFSCASRELRNL